MEPDDESDLPPDEPIATEAEVRQALSALDDGALARLNASAKAILKRYPRLATLQAGDLVSMASLKALDGSRKWPKNRIDLLGLLIGTMRSLASSESRASATTEIPTVSEHELGNAEEADGRSFFDRVASDTRSPEDELLERSEQARKAAVIVTLRAKLADDTEALAILDLLLEDLPKRDIRARLSITEKTFWAADRRLNREIEKVANWRIDNGDETSKKR